MEEWLIRNQENLSIKQTERLKLILESDSELGGVLCDHGARGAAVESSGSSRVPVSLGGAGEVAKDHDNDRGEVAVSHAHGLV